MENGLLIGTVQVVCIHMESNQLIGLMVLCGIVAPIGIITYQWFLAT